ncbi:hypothetical protein [Neisseria dentiae]|uniref:hypothetical protein n=1 Tax=Neisseria dentiae TaxID=194197 RepID=UPI00359F3EBD
MNKPFAALLLVAAALPVCAQTYRSQNPYTSGELTLNRSRFEAAAVGASGNLCQISGRVRQHIWRDGNGCEVQFKTAKNSITLSVPEHAREACSAYCGHNASFEQTYHKLPAACTEQAAAQTERRFQTAYRGKRYADAVKIKQQYLNRCGSFLHITEQMRTRNDLAVSHKNAGNPAACRRTLQPLAEHMAGSSGFTAPPVYRESYERELQHARFNLKACGG